MENVEARQEDRTRTVAGVGRVGVVLPTYDEAETIAEALRRLAELDLPDLCVVVVDDGSPDGTADLAEQAAADWREGRLLHVVRRTSKDGLGRAYVAGMRTALELGCAAVVQMDADLSHPADAVPRMIAALADGADVVVGSRYAEGGELDADWPWSRRLLSRAANTYVSVLLRMGVRDATAGFVAWRAEVLERMDLSTIRSNGYAFQVETKWRARQLGAELREVPITFSERAAGSSKMSLQVKLEGLAMPWRLLLSRRR
ncbi:dolichol-phosphate mannosyltransferase [Streptoalloteichus tenebrarius]|uniref:Dolichol-phosphate mannosyltransferase n=1 Tax=Streptoalloteichus tenebrarius (strain ATCC 17920 / DSM 40477 / JCM 4838 / CBS 697.72 / NBRC 16177 / NCIMB 11028 / NRRL B-12390 / A12253. 1 / ISP 5477) TaxID=1933 RepID=A0ABT1I158_STRSD|nr:polyprenol monophosphomannose synthase [Streptoalloteichus tenebrarius]MCP2261524.1 dolichol-phosphate mannosyltransferase [Streptoalloteichus tenebrarius]BFE99316.1 polyprenol monophosphomannose synthase [Streptoalloteichus tenebrarius]